MLGRLLCSLGQQLIKLLFCHLNKHFLFSRGSLSRLLVNLSILNLWCATNLSECLFGLLRGCHTANLCGIQLHSFRRLFTYKVLHILNVVRFWLIRNSPFCVLNKAAKEVLDGVYVCFLLHLLLLLIVEYIHICLNSGLFRLFDLLLPRQSRCFSSRLLSSGISISLIDGLSSILSVLDGILGL